MTTQHKAFSALRPRLTRVLPLGVFAFLAANAHAICVQQRSFVNSVGYQAYTPPMPPPLMYLAAVGAVPLRFAPPPPVATERPPRPQPALDLPPAEPATPETNETATPSNPLSNSAPTPEKKDDASTQAPAPDNEAVRILPDDTPRDIRPQDVLPYFQLSRDPESGSGVAVPFTPAAPTQPPSSATYQLK